MLMDSTAPSKDMIWQTVLKKEDPTIYCLHVAHLIEKLWLTVKGWKTIYQSNGPGKQIGVVVLT
jgi:hypothetical protein